jgi:hypothetical protein
MFFYTFALEKLSLQSLRKRRHDLGTLFFQSIVALNSALPSWKILSLCIPTRNIRDFSMFGVPLSNKRSPSARCVYASNVVGKDLDIFPIGAVSLNQIL